MKGMANHKVHVTSVFKTGGGKEIKKSVNDKLVRIICMNESNDNVKYIVKK
jgi:hypothetical protein